MAKRICRKKVVTIGAPENAPDRRVYRGEERERLFPGPSKEVIEEIERLGRMAVGNPHRLRGYVLD